MVASLHRVCAPGIGTSSAIPDEQRGLHKGLTERGGQIPSQLRLGFALVSLRSCSQGTCSPSRHELSVVWSQLLSLCMNPEQAVNIQPLSGENVVYPGPQGSLQTVCACNGVSYNLMVGRFD